MHGLEILKLLGRKFCTTTFNMKNYMEMKKRNVKINSHSYILILFRMHNSSIATSIKFKIRVYMNTNLWMINIIQTNISNYYHQVNHINGWLILGTNKKISRACTLYLHARPNTKKYNHYIFIINAISKQNYEYIYIIHNNNFIIYFR